MFIAGGGGFSLSFLYAECSAEKLHNFNIFFFWLDLTRDVAKGSREATALPKFYFDPQIISDERKFLQNFMHFEPKNVTLPPPIFFPHKFFLAPPPKKKIPFRLEPDQE